MVPGMAMITASATPRHRGSFLSVNTSISHMAIGLASILAGWILGDTNSGAPLQHYSLIGVLAASAALSTVLMAGWIRPAPGGRDATAAVEGPAPDAVAEADPVASVNREAPPDAVPA
jgi:MFS family permease